jgi:type VI secretion system protein VasJ
MAIEHIQERVRQWTQPISAEAPAGRAAKGDAAYEAALGEVAKLESVTGAPVDWASVLQSSAQVLQKTSKDLRIASYLAFGLYQTQGLAGLAAGAQLLAEVVDGFWPALFPELSRMRGRVSAVSWFVEKTCLTLSSTKVGESDRASVEALEAAVKKLADVTRQKFEANAPAMRPLLDAAQRLRASLPEKQAPKAPALPSQAAPTPPQGQLAAPPPPADGPAPAAPATAPAPVLTAAAPPPPATAEAAVDYLRQVGTGLASTAALVRRANPSDPAPYRLLRLGLWLHLAQPPPANGNRTAIPPPPAPLRAQLERMSANAKWAEVVEEAESALVAHRFWLDLHFFSARALRELGPTHQRAREALLAELAAALKRFKGVTELTFNDGTPLADPQTASWISQEVLAAAAAPGTAKAADGDGAGEGEAEARALAAGGKVAEAIALLQARILSAAGGRTRLLARLSLAQLCAGAGQLPLARAIYEELDREIVSHGIDSWEPPLAARCLEGLLTATRPAPKAPEAIASAWSNRYARLCLLDPSASLRIGPAS